MIKITLIFCLVFIGAVNEQSVYEITWEKGINGSAASPTIERGYTVRWTWTDGSYKSVSSLSKGSESFDSGMIKGAPKFFEHTFSNLGVTEYQNDNNPSMRGVVTVVNKLSPEDKFIKNISFYPNPVKNSLTISSLFTLEHYQVYTVLVALVAEVKGAGNVTRVNMDMLNSGLYFVKIFSANNMQSTLKISKS